MADLFDMIFEDDSEKTKDADAPPYPQKADGDPPDDIDVALPTIAEVVPFPTRELPMPIRSSLTPEINLDLLLTFVPDIRLKHALDVAAALALQVKVEGNEGCKAADSALNSVRSGIGKINACFEYPVSTAFSLHRRMTGLRGEFLAQGESALDTVAKRIIVEQQRIKAESERKRREDQEKANQEARATAARAAESGKKAEAPPEVVAQLEQRAKTAVAPPVEKEAPAPLANSNVGDKFRAKLNGTEETPDAEDYHRKVKDLSADENQSVMKMMRSCLEGHTPLAVFEINWSTLDSMADKQGTGFNVPGVSRVNVGKLSKKRRK